MKRYIDPMDLKRDLVVADILGDDRTIEKIIDDVPSANVKEIVHGRWIGQVHMFDGNTYYHCSECGEESKDAYSWRGFQKYCPWCGAIMDKNE